MFTIVLRYSSNNFARVLVPVNPVLVRFLFVFSLPSLDCCPVNSFSVLSVLVEFWSAVNVLVLFSLPVPAVIVAVDVSFSFRFVP